MSAGSDAVHRFSGLNSIKKKEIDSFRSIRHISRLSHYWAAFVFMIQVLANGINVEEVVTGTLAVFVCIGLPGAQSRKAGALRD